MTQEEFATRKRRISMIAGVGVFSLLCSYTLGYAVPGNGQGAILFTAIFFACIFIAARMAFKLKKETAPK
jgi:hypothetical protein